jgi:hypothetical protein
MAIPINSNPYISRLSTGYHNNLAPKKNLKNSPTPAIQALSLNPKSLIEAQLIQHLNSTKGNENNQKLKNFLSKYQKADENNDLESCINRYLNANQYIQDFEQSFTNYTKYIKYDFYEKNRLLNTKIIEAELSSIDTLLLNNKVTLKITDGEFTPKNIKFLFEEILLK